jgi:uncharacterized protein
VIDRASSSDAPAAQFSQGDRFQVLALDGGGVKGIFSAAFIAGLERDLGRSLVDHFDLIVGTSTGGVIATALGAGLSGDDIVDAYVDNMSRIFSGARGVRNVRRLLRAKYSPSGLESVLRELLGERRLGESRVPLVVPSFDLGEQRVYLFKTPHHPHLRRDWRTPMWQVAMATSAAPTYFPAYCLPHDGIRLVDGGVFANNPSMIGLTEAVSMFGQPLTTIRVLSIGTTFDPRVRSRSLDRGGVFQWIRSPSVFDILMAGQSIGAHNQVQHLIGKERAVRIDVQAPPGLTRLDEADARDLLAKAAYHSRNFCPAFEDTFAAHTPPAYRPHHGLLQESES